MAKGDQKDRLSRLRKQSGFAPVWTDHALLRLREYSLNKLLCERIVRNSPLRMAEEDMGGRATVHAVGNHDGTPLAVVVTVTEADEIEIAKVVTLKPGKR